MAGFLGRNILSLFSKSNNIESSSNTSNDTPIADDKVLNHPEAATSYKLWNSIANWTGHTYRTASLKPDAQPRPRYKYDPKRRTPILELPNELLEQILSDVTANAGNSDNLYCPLGGDIPVPGETERWKSSTNPATYGRALLCCKRIYEVGLPLCFARYFDGEITTKRYAPRNIQSAKEEDYGSVLICRWVNKKANSLVRNSHHYEEHAVVKRVAGNFTTNYEHVRKMLTWSLDLDLLSRRNVLAYHAHNISTIVIELQWWIWSRGNVYDVPSSTFIDALCECMRLCTRLSWLRLQFEPWNSGCYGTARDEGAYPEVFKEYTAKLISSMPPGLKRVDVSLDCPHFDAPSADHAVAGLDKNSGHEHKTKDNCKEQMPQPSLCLQIASIKCHEGIERFTVALEQECSVFARDNDFTFQNIDMNNEKVGGLRMKYSHIYTYKKEK
jgi:hypothetical protein